MRWCVRYQAEQKMYIPYGGNEKEEAARYQAAWKTCSVAEMKSSQISGGTENVYTAWRAGLGAVQKTEPESDFK